MKEYGGPAFQVRHFKCECGAITDQHWYDLYRNGNSEGNPMFSPAATGLWLCVCSACRKVSIWQSYRVGMRNAKLEGRPLTPLSIGMSPHADMPEAAKAIYEEARLVCGSSPRSAAALLRLATEVLCNCLLGLPVDDGSKLTNKIGKLVKEKALPVVVQQALDSLRVIGNNAVHPGQIDFAEASDTASRLFTLLNVIVEQVITQPRLISGTYDKHLTEGEKQHVKKRDGK